MKMGTRKFKRYNEDFKLRAVKLCLESDKHDAEIARDLGVHQTTLSTWKQKYLKNQKQAFSGHKEPDAFSEELKLLKKELRIAQEERDILKKALAICNSEQKRNML
jgi:transposase